MATKKESLYVVNHFGRDHFIWAESAVAARADAVRCQSHGTGRSDGHGGIHRRYGRGTDDEADGITVERTSPPSPLSFAILAKERGRKCDWEREKGGSMYPLFLVVFVGRIRFAADCKPYGSPLHRVNASVARDHGGDGEGPGVRNVA